MRFREVFSYELTHRVRSISTWVYATILFGLAFLFLSDPGEVGAVRVDAPIELATGTLLLGHFGMLVSAALFCDAAVRDVQATMDPLLFTSPLRKVEYLGGRFLAALATNAVVLLAIPLGLLACALTGSSDPAAFGTFRPGAYLGTRPYVLFVLPNVVLTGAVLFTTGVLTRKQVPVYLCGLGLFVVYLLTGEASDQTQDPVLSALGDPLGIRALNDRTAYWTAAERNDRLIGFPPDLVLNRVVWLAVAAVVLAVLHRRFRFAHQDGGGRRRKAVRAVVGPGSGRARPVEVPRVSGSFGIRTTSRQTLAVARRSLAEVVASRWFVGVLFACAGLTMLWGWNVSDTVFDTSTWPVTLLVVETVLSERVTPLVYVLLAVYAGELVWKQRESGVAEIADAAPVPDGAALIGRFLALVAMIAMIQAATMVGGILLQAFQGHDQFELGLYVRVVFGLDLADYVLLAVLAMTIHVVVNHKYLGHVLALLAILFTMAAEALGIRHHLLVYGSDPGWTYSDMNGFGPFVGPFVWFKLYWAAWALLLVLVALVFSVRGRESGARGRLRQARARITGPVARAAGVAVALIIGLGGFVFYNTNLLNAYRTLDELGAPQAEYEKRYARYAAAPQPVITDAELRIEIHPDEPALDLGGSYALVNRSGAPIDSVHVTFFTPDIRTRSISFDRPAEPVLVDEEVGYRIYALERALEPGDTVHLVFDTELRPRGFPNSGIQTDVVGNGTHVDRRWLPLIGYQPAVELTGAEERDRFGLAPRPPRPSPDDPEAGWSRHEIRDADFVHVETIIGTAADQIAITPGVLRRTWTEDGRRYFHYETEVPTEFGASVFSAEYAVLEDRWNDVELSVFHHPTHDYDLDRIVSGMKASLDYYTEHFGPYPDRQLRIVEIPRYGGFGRAHPHTISFTEDFFFSRVGDGEVDQPFFGTAHEVAHQWWGGQVRGAPVRGAGFLSESLANYSAMMVVEKTYGPEAARRLYDFQMERYLRGRATLSLEVPLLEVEGQAYIAYRKGAIALYTLQEHIGEDAVDTALRRYLEKYRDSGPPYPTSLDLYVELRAVTPDSLEYLLTDLFETVTLWDVETERAVVEPTGTGEYEVALRVRATKVRADGVGNETEVPMDDFIEIGVFAPGEGYGLGEPLHLERHRIRSGEQTIRVTVPSEPARAGIDPHGELIDRRRDDNVVGVERTRAR